MSHLVKGIRDKRSLSGCVYYQASHWFHVALEVVSVEAVNNLFDDSFKWFADEDGHFEQGIQLKSTIGLKPILI